MSQSVMATALRLCASLEEVALLKRHLALALLNPPRTPPDVPSEFESDDPVEDEDGDLEELDDEDEDGEVA